MKTSLEFKSRNTIGWAPSVGYLLTLMGGVSVAAVGCHERGASTDANRVSSSPSAYQPAVVTAAVREALAASSVATSVSPNQPESKAASAGLAAAGAAVVPPAPSAPALKPAALEVKRFVVTSGVENREPLAVGEALTLGQPAYAFAELSSGSGTSAVVEIVFEHEGGRKVGHVKLDVPADKSRWRTWGQSRGVTKAGHWTAVLLDAERTELARVAFDVAASEPAVAAPGSTVALPQAIIAAPEPVVVAATRQGS